MRICCIQDHLRYQIVARKVRSIFVHCHSRGKRYCAHFGYRRKLYTFVMDGPRVPAAL